MQRAAAFGVRHLAMPPFGTGAGNLDVDDAAQAMVEAIVRHLAPSPLPERVTVVVESELERESFASRIAWLASS
jgi:O-acetyl-ADP-ribose deacetylase (regulator of RNase III)